MNRNISLQNGELVTILTKEKKQGKTRFISLRWLLLFAYAITGIIPLLLMTGIMLRSVQDYFEEERKKELLQQMNADLYERAKNEKVFEIY